MPQKPVANARAFGRSSDQAGNIGDNELAGLMRDNAQLRARGGEGISPDLCIGVADLVDKGRFPGIGQSNQSGISKQLQPQPDIHFFGIPAGAMLARRAVGGAFEGRIAASAVSAAQEGDTLANLG